MKVTALRNFDANDVFGYPGYVLSKEDLEKVAPIFDEMKKEGLIKIEEGDPAPNAPQGDADLPGEDLPVAPPKEPENPQKEPEAPVAPEESAKSKKKK